jgi:hypothetical protein
MTVRSRILVLSLFSALVSAATAQEAAPVELPAPPPAVAPGALDPAEAARVAYVCLADRIIREEPGYCIQCGTALTTSTVGQVVAAADAQAAAAADTTEMY